VSRMGCTSRRGSFDITVLLDDPLERFWQPANLA